MAMYDSTRSKIPRIVIIGGGVAGLALATRLGNALGKHKRAEIKLIDYARTHVWKPLYHQVAAGVLDPCLDQTEYFLQAKQHHFQFHWGRLKAIDRHQQSIQLEAMVDDQNSCIMPSRALQYDILVFSVGSIANDFGITGVAKHCHFLDTLYQATCFNKHFFNSYLKAQMQTQFLRPGQLKIAIVGTGATGVELAAELHTAAQNLASYNLDKFESNRNIQISLIGGAETILSGLPTSLITAVAKQLDKLGIRCYNNEWVNEVTSTGVKTKSGLFIDSEFTVWAGGIKAPDFLTQLDGLETNSINQLRVDATLQTTLDAKIFALGDCAAIRWKAEKWVPPRAQAAHQQAKFMVKAIHAYLANDKIPHFFYKDYGSLVSLGKYSAVGNLMGAMTKDYLFVEGYIAQYIYATLYKKHQISLHGLWRTLLLSLVDMIKKRVKPRVKLH